jgi:hypothetical protein
LSQKILDNNEQIVFFQKLSDQKQGRLINSQSKHPMHPLREWNAQTSAKEETTGKTTHEQDFS